MTATPFRDDVAAMIERALRRAVAGAISIDEAVEVATAELIRRSLATTPAERVAEEAAQLLARYDAAGGDRDREAAGKVAAAVTTCPHEREIVAQRVRRLARKRRERK